MRTFYARSEFFLFTDSATTDIYPYLHTLSLHVALPISLPIFLLWLYLSWLVVLLGATVASILPDLRMRRWALQHYPGGAFVHAMRVLRVLWHAQDGLPRGRSMRFLCAQIGRAHV